MTRISPSPRMPATAPQRSRPKRRMRVWNQIVIDGAASALLIAFVSIERNAQMRLTKSCAPIVALAASVALSACHADGPTHPSITPAADEPVFEASDRSLYDEGFEGFASLSAVHAMDFARGCYVYSNPSMQQFPAPAPAHGGAKAFRINYPVSSTYHDQDTVLECPGLQDAPAGQFTVVEAWIRTKAGYPWRRDQAGDQQGAGEKTIIWNQGSSSVPRFVLGGGYQPSGTWWNGKYDAAYPSSGVGLVLSVDGPMVGGTGTFWYFQNMNGAARDPIGYLNDGNYHLWKLKLTPGTTQTGTSGNGAIEMWVDGMKVIEYIGSDPSRPEYNKVLVPRVNAVVQSLDIGGPFNGGPSSAQGAQWKDYDDLRVWVRP